MAYPFVSSYHDYGPRDVRIKPLHPVVHMAEGGGTVGYLSRKNPNGVSVHYVVEYSGRVVQMLREDHVNGSINPRDIRTTDDPPYTFGDETVRYGASAARAALGIWWDDPNRATIGIEIEGFAKDGPNRDQSVALVKLIRDIHSRHPDAHNLAHRDFADYKGCPGKRIDWPSLGGHGTTGKGDMDLPKITNTSRVLVDIPVGATLYEHDRETVNTKNHIARTVESPYGSNEYRMFALDPDGTGDDPRTLLWVKEFSNMRPVVPPAPEPAAYDVIVGGKPVGSVTLP
jgi:hypothetical protein